MAIIILSAISRTLPMPVRTVRILPALLVACMLGLVTPTRAEPTDALKVSQLDPDSVMCTLWIFPARDRNWKERQVLRSVLLNPESFLGCIEQSATWKNGEPLGVNVRISREEIAALLAMLEKYEIFVGTPVYFACERDKAADPPPLPGTISMWEKKSVEPGPNTGSISLQGRLGKVPLQYERPLDLRQTHKLFAEIQKHVNPKAKKAIAKLLEPMK